MMTLMISAPSWGGPIFMPAGSTVWMKMSSNGCVTPPITRPGDGDCIGSNEAGPNPPNGIPMSTFTNSGSITGFAEVLPDRVRTFMRSRNGFMNASFEDQYTVGGTASGPFDITVELHVTGKARSIPFASGANAQALAIWTVEIEIGNFSPIGDAGGGVPLVEQNRVTRFAPTNRAVIGGLGFELSPTPFEHDIDITTTYTRTGVQIGDIFDIGYGVNSGFAIGEIDLRDTAMIGFDLPDGVFLTSRLGGEFGVTPEAPEPMSWTLMAAGLGLIGWMRRRQ